MPKSFLRLSLLIAVFSSALFASPTTITDNVSAIGGIVRDHIIRMSVVANAFTAADGASVSAATTNVVISTTGAFSVALSPNTGTSGIYTVTYTSASMTYTEYLTVPVSASPIILAQARPQGALLAASDGMYYLLPGVSPTASTGGGGGGGSSAWGSITGTLSDQTDLNTALASKTTTAQAAAAAPVQTVAGQTGNVTLTASDISGSAPNPTTATFGASTGASNLFTVQDSTNNVGTGYVFTAGTAAGSAANPLQVLAKGTQVFGISAAGVATLKGNLLFGTDNAYTIGATTNQRPSDVFVVNTVTLSGVGHFLWGGRSRILSPADSQILLRNNAQTGFSMLQFGGTLSTFPAIKVNGSDLQIIRADGTTAANLEVTGALTVDGATSQFGDTTGTTSGYAGFDNSRAIFGYDATNSNALMQGGLSKGIEFAVNNATAGSGVVWKIDTSGNLLSSTDGTASIGASASNRPANVYVTGNVNSGNFNGGNFTAGSVSVVSWTSRTKITSPADSQLLLRNSAQTGFSLLEFGGTTSSFPALKVNGSDLQVIRADGTTSANMASGSFATSPTSVTTPTTITTSQGFLVCNGGSVTMPASPLGGLSVTVVNVGAAACTVDGNGFGIGNVTSSIPTSISVAAGSSTILMFDAASTTNAWRVAK